MTDCGADSCSREKFWILVLLDYNFDVSKAKKLNFPLTVGAAAPAVKGRRGRKEKIETEITSRFYKNNNSRGEGTSENFWVRFSKYATDCYTVYGLRSTNRCIKLLNIRLDNRSNAKNTPVIPQKFKSAFDETARENPRPNRGKIRYNPCI